MKAVRITSDNKQKLEDRYKMSAGTLDLASGLYLVAGFGDTQYEGLLTKSALITKFFMTGVKLDKDGIAFIEVVKKGDYVSGTIFSDV